MALDHKQIRWNFHQNHLQAMFARQRQQDRYCDVTLVCKDGRTVKAHRAILSACSAFFDSFLTNENCGKETIVIIKDCQFEEVALLIEFMYTGQIIVAAVSLFSCFILDFSYEICIDYRKLFRSFIFVQIRIKCVVYLHEFSIRSRID